MCEDFKGKRFSRSTSHTLWSGREKVEFDLDKYVGKQIDYLSLIIGRRNNQ